MTAVPLTAARVRAWLPRRPMASHKGLNGHVLVIAGSRGMSGAAILCALGALRAGAGLVTVAIVKGERQAAVRRVPEALTLALPETRNGVISAGAYRTIERYMKQRPVQAIALGPGLSVNPVVRQLILSLLGRTSIPIVLDADGLNNIKDRDVPRRGSLVITPHVGELARFLGVTKKVVQLQGQTLLEKLALRLTGVCLLKGHRTIVTDGVRTYRNSTGNQAMATGGMGDVLTGAIASFMAQGLAPLEAAASGVFLHGLAGDLVRVSDRGLLATEVAAALPSALKKIGVK